MIDPLMFFYAVWFALTTTVLYILIGYLPDFRLKILFPLICGSILGFFVIIINPQFAYDLPGIPYYLKNFCFPLILPLFILTPLLVIEKRAGTTFGKMLVFSGALLTAIAFILISQSGIRLGIGLWQTESLVWTGSVLIVSFLVFFSIDRIRNLVPGFFRQGRKSTGLLTEQYSPVPAGKNIFASLCCLVLLCSPMAAFDYYSHSTSSCGRFDIYEVGNFSSPEITLIHLTDNDLNAFPEMKPAITEGSVDGGACDNLSPPALGGKCLGSRYYRCSEGGLFKKYGNMPDHAVSDPSDDVYLEYHGKIFYMVMTRMS